MHFSRLTAGMLLARLARPEVSNCIAGLKQYNYAYEEAGEEAIEMERLYSSALNGESDLTHMSSVVNTLNGHHSPQMDHSMQRHQAQQSIVMSIDSSYVGVPDVRNICSHSACLRSVDSIPQMVTDMVYTMAGQLSSLANKVIRMLIEVRTDGKPGRQAVVVNVEGMWKVSTGVLSFLSSCPRPFYWTAHTNKHDSCVCALADPDRQRESNGDEPDGLGALDHRGDQGGPEEHGGA